MPSRKKSYDYEKLSSVKKNEKYEEFQEIAIRWMEKISFLRQLILRLMKKKRKKNYFMHELLVWIDLCWLFLASVSQKQQHQTATD